MDTQRWKSKKALTLFKILAERCGSRHPKDVLIEALWAGDDNFERTSHNLHTVVYYLRRELEPGLKRYEPSKLVRHSAGLYWLESGPGVRVDVVEFRRLLRAAETLQTKDPSAALARYKEALALYTDDFLPEDLYEDWAAAVREALREQYFTSVAAVAELAYKLEADRSYATSLCRRALRRDGLREELHRGLIKLLAQQGLYGEAAEQYRQCERILDDEFGVRPGPETRSVYELLLAGLDVEARSDVGTVTTPDPERDAGAGSGTGVGSGTGAGSGTGGAIMDVGEQDLAIPMADPIDGPTMCSRDTYNFLHKLELRRQAHTGLPMALVRIALGAGVRATVPDAAERATCVQVLSDVLRSGDVFCWESANRLLIQLPATNSDGALLVKARLQHALEQAGLIFFEIRHSVIDGVRLTAMPLPEAAAEGGGA